jgi:hypothetical protein
LRNDPSGLRNDPIGGGVAQRGAAINLRRGRVGRCGDTTKTHGVPRGRAQTSQPFR